METKKKKKRKEPAINKWYVIIPIIFIVIGIWGLSWFLIDSCIPDSGQGIFGDKFGAVNSLFSGLAFAGIIYTILQQREELKLTRKELKSTRKEFEIQNETLLVQKFEDTFFNLTKHFAQIVDGLIIVYPIVKTQREVFEVLRKRLNEKMAVYSLKTEYSGWKQQFENAYAEYRNNNSQYYLHYFKYMLIIFRYVDRSDIPTDEEKKAYFEIFFTQLSLIERTLLFYFLAMDSNCDNVFKELVNKYKLIPTTHNLLLLDSAHEELIDRFKA